jgi:TatD DNase family protein
MVNIHTHASKEPHQTELINLYPWELHNNGHYFSIGIHPWYIDQDRLKTDLITIENQLANPKVLAIGECGLDKRIDIPFDLQITVFKEQLLLAQTHQKPVIIHCVNAYQEVIKIKQELQINVPFIIHGFSKSLELANLLLKNDCYLSFGKYLILNENLGEVLNHIPLNQCFLETDNTSFTIEDIYKKTSDLTKKTIPELEIIFKSNFEKVFLQNKVYES